MTTTTVPSATLPENLTIAHRCDLCSGGVSQAYHAFTLKTGQLLACNHHARAIHSAGTEYTDHRDYRTAGDQTTPRHLTPWDILHWSTR